MNFKNRIYIDFKKGKFKGYYASLCIVRRNIIKFKEHKYARKSFQIKFHEILFMLGDSSISKMK